MDYIAKVTSWIPFTVPDVAPWADSDRIFIWDTYLRLLFLTYFYAIAQLFWQIEGLAGEKGVTPFATRLAALRRDIPSKWRRFFYLPTWLQISSTDLFMKTIIVCGATAALLGALFPFYHPVVVRPLLFTCWSIYLSLMPAGMLYWPWDLLLTESGFLGLFLTAGSLPNPTVAFAHRWLLFRLMFSFGKLKFLGTSPEDRMYLKEFYTAQPHPSWLGWYLQQYLPRVAHLLALGFYWFAEIPLPFLLLFNGWYRIVAAVLTAILQLGIQVAGNFGFFNVLTLILCIPCLDTGYGALELDYTHPYMFFIFPVSLYYLLFNTWVTASWTYWPSLRFIPFRSFFRFFQNFQFINSYGVFPPHSVPADRYIPVIEASDDGKHWEEYEFHWLTSGKDWMPPKIEAPYHPRLDYTLFYNFIGGIDNIYVTLGASDPYAYRRSSLHHRLCARLLEGAAPCIMQLFRVNPFPDPQAPPKFVRVQMYMYRPTHGHALQYFERQYIQPHLPAMTLESVSDQFHTLPTAELWHPEHEVWFRQMQRYHPEVYGEAALLASTVDDRTHPFWTRFLPWLQIQITRTTSISTHSTWSEQTRFLYAQVRQRFSAEELKEFERMLGRITWLLAGKLEQCQAVKQHLTHYHQLHLLAHMILLSDRVSLSHVLNDPSAAEVEASRFSYERSMFVMSIFWLPFLEYQARKFRLMQVVIVRDESNYAQQFMPYFLSRSFVQWMAQQYLPLTPELAEDLPKYKRTVTYGWVPTS